MREFETYAEMASSVQSKIGLRGVCRERADAPYILMPSGYVPLPGDIPLPNGPVWALQLDGKALSGWFASLSDAVSRSRDVLVTQDYTVSSVLSVNCTSEPFNIDLGGHTLTSDNAGVFSVFGDLLYTQNVTSHTANTITITASNTLIDYLVANIDDRPVIKIVSDDAIDAAEAADERRGEHARVVSVASGVLTLESDLYFTYTTSPRVAALVSEKFTLKNGSLDVSDLGVVRGTQIFATKLKEPLIENIKIKKGNDAGIVLRSCYHAKVVGPSIHNLRDDAGGGYFGYGIDDNSSHGTLVTDGNFSNTRHAYTTNTGESTVGGDMASFGPTIYSTVRDCYCSGNSDDAFDTHPNAYFITFDNVKGYGNDAGLIKDRAKFTTVNNPISEDDNFSIRSTGNSDGMVVISPISRNSTNPLFFDNVNHGTVTIKGGSIELTDGNELCRLTNVTLKGDVNVTYSGSINFSKAFRMTSSTARLDDLKVDLTDCTSANFRIFEIASGGDNDINVKSMTIDAVSGANAINVVNDATGTGTNKAVIHESLVVDHDQLSGNALSSDSYSVQRWNGGDSSSFFKTITASDQGIPELIYNGAPKIVMFVTVTGSTKNLVALPDGVFAGQQLQISLSKNSAFFITIRHGSTYNTDLIGGADITLGTGESLSLMWNGTDWESYVQTN